MPGKTWRTCSVVSTRRIMPSGRHRAPAERGDDHPARPCDDGALHREPVERASFLEKSQLVWSGWRESNPHLKDGSLARCHYDTPARLPLLEAPIPMAVRAN